MSDLLQKLKQRTGSKRGVYYGYMIFWSDGFLTSWVKQKDNSAWILTVIWQVIVHRALTGAIITEIHS